LGIWLQNSRLSVYYLFNGAKLLSWLVHINHRSRKVRHMVRSSLIIMQTEVIFTKFISILTDPVTFSLLRENSCKRLVDCPDTEPSTIHVGTEGSNGFNNRMS